MGLDTVEFVMSIENEFSIKLSDEEASKTETVEQFCRLVREKCLQKDGFRAPSYTSIYKKIAQTLQNDFSVEKEKINPNAKFVKDLGLD